MFSVRYTSPRVTPKEVTARRDASGLTPGKIESSLSRGTEADVDTTLNDSALPRENLFALLSGPGCNGKVQQPTNSSVQVRKDVTIAVYESDCDKPGSSWQSQAEDFLGDIPVGENTTEATLDDLSANGLIHSQRSDGDNGLDVQDGGDGIESDTIKLPPMVARTACAQRHPPFMPELTQKQPLTETHSLLDDASDEDEIYEIQNPTTYNSCDPMRRQRTQHHRRARSANSIAASSNQLTSNTIQQALLQTRHRRWDCLSAYAGQHQQPSNLFDLSSRSYIIPTFNCCNNPHGTTDSMALATRLSVSTQSVKAAAIASGLFRTATVVRLPAGLLLPHFAVVRNRDTNHLGPALIEEYKSDSDDVWELLRTIGSTFSLCCEVDFGGDLAGVSEDCITWRNDVIVTILKILPSLSSVDGITVSSFSADYPFVKVDQFDSISGPYDLMMPIPMPRSQSWGPGCSGSKPPRSSASATARIIKTTSKKKRNGSMRRILSVTKEASLMDGEESDESDMQ